MGDLESFKKILGLKIKELREREGLTQPQLGAMIDKDYQAISRIERGLVNPSAFLILEIASALKVDMNEIFSLSQGS